MGLAVCVLRHCEEASSAVDFEQRQRCYAATHCHARLQVLSHARKSEKLGRSEEVKCLSQNMFRTKPLCIVAPPGAMSVMYFVEADVVFFTLSFSDFEWSIVEPSYVVTYKRRVAFHVFSPPSSKQFSVLSLLSSCSFLLCHG